MSRRKAAPSAAASCRRKPERNPDDRCATPVYLRPVGHRRSAARAVPLPPEVIARPDREGQRLASERHVATLRAEPGRLAHGRGYGGAARDGGAGAVLRWRAGGAWVEDARVDAPARFVRVDRPADGQQVPAAHRVDHQPSVGLKLQRAVPDDDGGAKLAECLVVQRAEVQALRLPARRTEQGEQLATAARRQRLVRLPHQLTQPIPQHHQRVVDGRGAHQQVLVPVQPAPHLCHCRPATRRWRVVLRRQRGCGAPTEAPPPPRQRGHAPPPERPVLERAGRLVPQVRDRG